MNNNMPITIQTTINAPIEKVWECWTEPKHIVKWAFAQDDWEAPFAENDVKVGGRFKTTMAAKDKSASFDFTGVYTVVDQYQKIAYDIDDGRHVKAEFTETPEGVKIIQTFDPEQQNPPELQQKGWQGILDNFKKYVEAQ
jgi:uncharacterized protein YndB with AHSA1/START domain